MTDDELHLLLSQGELTPYPGVWQQPPYAEHTTGDVRYAVVAIDAGLSVLGVRRDDGSLWGLPDDGEPFPSGTSRRRSSATV